MKNSNESIHDLEVPKRQLTSRRKFLQCLFLSSGRHLPVAACNNCYDQQLEGVIMSLSGDAAVALTPYRCEPKRTGNTPESSENSASSAEDTDEELGRLSLASRVGNNEWCSCGNCGVMPTSQESFCSVQKVSRAYFFPTHQHESRTEGELYARDCSRPECCFHVRQ